MVSSRSFSPGSARPRWATPATPGRPDLAGKVAWTASALGFRGLMAHQRQIIATGTERLADGRPAFRQVVIEEPRQQGKSVSVLSLIRSEEHTSELQSPDHLVCRLLLEKKKKI